jgi:hypothetical protein
MLSILITTTKTYGTPAIHTVIAQFENKAAALQAVNIINGQKFDDGMKQTAIQLF